MCEYLLARVRGTEGRLGIWDPEVKPYIKLEPYPNFQIARNK